MAVAPNPVPPKSEGAVDAGALPSPPNGVATLVAVDPKDPKPDDVVLVPKPNPAWLVVAVFVPPNANDAAMLHNILNRYLKGIMMNKQIQAYSY